MAKSDEQERRERLELLKMKQGLISESELIPEAQEKPAPAPLTAKQKAANFFYYYKWVLLISVIGIALVAVFIVKLVTQVKPDIGVLLIGTKEGSDLHIRVNQVQLALEMFCPDLNEDGKINVDVLAIDLDCEPADGQYYLAQTMLFDAELRGERCLVISDDGFIGYLSEKTTAYTDHLLPLGGGYSIPVSETALSEALGDFPNNAYIYFLNSDRDEALIKNSETVLNALLAN